MLFANIRIGIIWVIDRERDIDGGIKAMLDLGEQMGLYENDKQVTELHVYKRFTKETEKPFVEFSIEPSIL